MKARKKNKPFSEVEIKIKESGKIIDKVSFKDRNLIDEYLDKFSLMGDKNEKNKSKSKK